MNDKLVAVKTRLEDVLKKENSHVEIDGRLSFITKNNVYIRLDIINDFNCIVIEYADNKREAKKNRYEDGDLLRLNEYSFEEMLEFIRKEIEKY